MNGVNFAGANLARCSCATCDFGKECKINASTTLDNGNHTLISMVLLSRAQTVEQQKFALYIRYQKSTCWAGFTRLLLRQREFAPWVKEALTTVHGLEAMVSKYEEVLQALLEERRDRLYVGDINQSLQWLLSCEIDQHPFMKSPDLYWYLQGVLALAYRQPETALDEQQQQIILTRLQAFTNLTSD